MSLENLHWFDLLYRAWPLPGLTSIALPSRDIQYWNIIFVQFLPERTPSLPARIPLKKNPELHPSSDWNHLAAVLMKMDFYTDILAALPLELSIRVFKTPFTR
jgi:hypothetical protein